MKNHAYRPLFVILGIVALILIARALVVPDDFGVHEMGYRFGWHRLGNEKEWKDFKVKYQGRDYCASCHPDKIEMIDKSPHVIIQCENCHGPAIKIVDEGKGLMDTYKNPKFTKHGEDTFKNDIDRSREQCTRCHAYLPYAQSGRAKIRTIKEKDHYEGECVSCHNPHSPGMG